jgi:cytochrome c oxidase assembly protein subunit 11
MSQADLSRGRPPLTPEARRNRKVAFICAAFFVAMIGAAYASVPLYRLFCQVTGFDGTVRRAEAAPGQVLAKKITVRFDANVRDLPWTFKPNQVAQTIKIGETGLAYFTVTNNGAMPMTGRAIYNVVPEQAGAYFQKIQCFCFSDQTIQPGQTVEFPVVYFVDPKYAEDFETKGAGEVTLSYTYFPSANAPAVEKAAAGPAPKHPSTLGGTAGAGL